MYSSAISNITKSYITRKCNEKFNPSEDVVDNKDFFAMDSLCCISQHTDQLRKFNHNQHINYDIDSFYPGSNWGFVNINKLKVKWKIQPEQLKLKGHVYSIFKPEAVRHLQNGSMHLYIFATDNPDLAVCIAPAMIKCSVEEVKESFKKFNVVRGNVALQHFDLKITNTLDNDDYSFSVGESKLECKIGLDHYHVTLDRHGVYVNKQSRNKIAYTEEPDVKYYIQNPMLIWIENVTSGNVLFQSVYTGDD